MFRRSSTEKRKVGGSIPPWVAIPELGCPRQFALRQLWSLAEFGGIRSGLDIFPNEELAVAGRTDDEHPPHPRVQEEVAMSQIKGTNPEA
jgi:hypothetical protein